MWYNAQTDALLADDNVIDKVQPPCRKGNRSNQIAILTIQNVIKRGLTTVMHRTIPPTSHVLIMADNQLAAMRILARMATTSWILLIPTAIARHQLSPKTTEQVVLWKTKEPYKNQPMHTLYASLIT